MKLFPSSIGPIAVGGIIRTLGWEKLPNWECMIVHRKRGLLLSEDVDDIKKGWEVAEPGFYVEEIDEKRGS